MTAHRPFKVAMLDLPLQRFNVQPVDFAPPLACANLKAMAYARGLLDACDISILSAPLSQLAGDARILGWIEEQQPDLLAFSLYPWNVSRSLYIAGKARERFPELRVVVGGCEVQDDADGLLRNPAVDVGVIGEGELPFCEILEHYLGGVKGPPAVQSTATCIEGELRFLPQTEGLTHLDDLPSPLLLGYIDPRAYASTSIETMRYCSFRCSYCSFYKRGNQQLRYSVERLIAEFQYAYDHDVRRFFFFDAALNTSPDFRAICEALIRIDKDGRIRSFADVQAELMTEEAADLLARANFKEIEVGLQSLDPTALKNVRRPFRGEKESFLRGVGRLREKGIDVFINLMIGLPGETLGSFRKGLEFIAGHGLSDGVTNTSVSVGMGTALRERADEFDIEYQKEAAYRVLSTREMSFADIKQAMLECAQLSSVSHRRYHAMIRPVPYLFCNSHPEEALSWDGVSDREFLDLGSALNGATPPLFPVSRIIVEEGIAHWKPAELKELGEYLSRHLSLAVVVQLESQASGRALNALGSLLSMVSSENPHVTYSIVLSEVSRDDEDRLAELALSIRGMVTNLDQEMVHLQEYREGKPLEHVRASTRFFLLQSPDRIASDWPGPTVDERYAVMDVARLTWNGNGALEQMQTTIRNMIAPCVLVDLPEEMAPQEILAAMRSISELPERGRASIRFSRWQHQHIWNILIEELSYLTPENETFLRVGRPGEGSISSITRATIQREMGVWILQNRRAEQASNESSSFPQGTTPAGES